jgi:hypothetical protein
MVEYLLSGSNGFDECGNSLDCRFLKNGQILHVGIGKKISHLRGGDTGERPVAKYWKLQYLLEIIYLDIFVLIDRDY